MEQNEDKSIKPQYLHIYPFRFVQPYPHVYRTFTKGRWLGKELLATLVREFKAYPPEYYAESIAKGLITVNGKQVSPSYGLKNGDQIIHTSIRIEPPILDLPIEIVHESEDFVIVNKPPSVIVHTGGGHHFNTVESLLKYEYGFKNLHVLHRLDKCTSGLLIFAKDKKQVGQFHEESENETMKKMYFARVAGCIEWSQKDLATHIQCISHKDGVYRAFDEIQNWKINHPDKLAEQDQKEKEVHKEGEEKGAEQKRQRIVIEKKKKANNEVKDNRDVKDSRTVFKKVWYDEETDSTLLECYPVTGRTHQIRVHLQYLGHPILNDTVYGGRFVGNGIIGQIDKRWSEGEEGQQPSKKMKPSQELKPESWDYETRAWEIMLHSYRYKFGGKQFTTKLPYWFKRDAIPSFKKQVQADK